MALQRCRPIAWLKAQRVRYSICNRKSTVCLIEFSFRVRVSISSVQRRYFKTFKEPKNRFQGIHSASLCSPVSRYDNPIPTRFLALIDCSKIPALLCTVHYTVYNTCICCSQIIYLKTEIVIDT
jgi:hypothetical protein